MDAVVPTRRGPALRRLFGNRRADLRSWRREVREWLWEQRRLRLKRPEARILSCGGHLDALGYRVTRSGVEALPRALSRLRGRVAGEMARPSWEPPRFDLNRSITASAGIVLF